MYKVLTRSITSSFGLHTYTAYGDYIGYDETYGYCPIELWACIYGYERFDESEVRPVEVANDNGVSNRHFRNTWTG